MHVENDLVEFVTAGVQEYDGVIKEYRRRCSYRRSFPEPPVTNTTDTTPAQGKSRCITRILIIYMLCIYVAGIL
jgi:hypothetical protein